MASEGVDIDEVVPRLRTRAARIFGEPPENADETWTHGAMLGGMCGYDDRSLADSYFLAGDALVGAVLGEKDSARTRELVAPTLYVYRHGIELFLKLIVRPKKPNHDLASLLGRFCRLVRIRYKSVEVTRPWSMLLNNPATPWSKLLN